MIVRIAALCVAAAMIASALRVQRPEMATALSLAAGLAVLALAFGQLGDVLKWVESFKALPNRFACLNEAMAATLSPLSFQTQPL